MPAQAQGGLPTLGDGSDLTSSEERRLGDRIIRELYRDPDYIDDPVIGEYVQGIWQPLMAAARARGELSPELDERFAWEVLLGRDRTVNAFALPGGYLGLHLGLIGVVGTRDELASVMAHELSHVTQRHISRLLTQQSRQTPLLLGAMVLGALAASKNPGATQALVVGGQALALQNQLNFSRDMEREADRVGMGLMEPAGFAPEGFVGMFDKLQQANRINDNGSWPYLRSHPLTTQRIADMQSRLPSGGLTASSPSVLQAEHAMVTARARVLSRPGVDVLRQWVAEPQGTGFAALPPARQAGVLYAAALGSSQLRDARRGPALGGAVAATGEERCCGHPVGKTAEGGAGTGSRRCTRCAGGHAAGDSRRAEMLLRTQILLRTGQSKEVTGPLQTWLATHPRDAFGVAGHGSGLECAGPATACGAGRGGSACGALRLRSGGGPASRPGRIWRGAALRPMTTSRRRSSTPGCASVQSLLREQATER